MESHPAWTMTSRYSDYRLADAHDALYNTASAVGPLATDRQELWD